MSDQRCFDNFGGKILFDKRKPSRDRAQIDRKKTPRHTEKSHVSVLSQGKIPLIFLERGVHCQNGRTPKRRHVLLYGP